MKNSDCLTSSITVMKYTGVWFPDNLTRGEKIAYTTFRWVTQTVMFFFIILAEIGYVYKPKDVHCWTKAAPKDLHIERSFAALNVVVGPSSLGLPTLRFPFRHDSERMVDAAVLLLSHLVQAVKVLTIIIRQERIKRLIELGDGPAFTHTDPKLKANLERAVKLAGLVGKLVLVSAGITSVFWFVVPALKDVLTLPLKIAYPFDISGAYIFAVMYVYSSLSVATCGVGDAAENFLVSGVLTLASTQVGLLHEQLLDIKDGDKDSCYKKAVLCVKFHQRIIEYVEEIAKIFGLPIFCQCVTSSVVVCMTAYKITITREPIELVTIIFYLVCVMMELLMYCYPADVLLNKSLQVADAAYPQWSGDVETARVLLLTALRAQRPLVVDAGGMFRISLPTAAAVVQTSYTYYALLQQKLDK